MKPITARLAKITRKHSFFIISAPGISCFFCARRSSFSIRENLFSRSYSLVFRSLRSFSIFIHLYSGGLCGFFCVFIRCRKDLLLQRLKWTSKEKMSKEPCLTAQRLLEPHGSISFFYLAFFASLPGETPCFQDQIVLFLGR